MITSPNPEELKRRLTSLIEKFNKLKLENDELAIKKEIGEYNVRKDFIDPLFEALGWSVRNYHEYDAESYVRGAGFVDIAIKIDGKVALFVEAKKFGRIPSRINNEFQTTLMGHRMPIDWTEEERQVLNYAGSRLDVKWAILTNFEKFRLFNAKTGITILDIEKPEDYLERLDDFVYLTKNYVQNGAINRLENRVERKDFDLNFLNVMNHWRLKLANEIYKRFPELVMEDLKRIVQRILDRLVIIRYAEDKWVLDDPDQLKAVYDFWQHTRSYTKITDSVRMMNRFEKL